MIDRDATDPRATDREGWGDQEPEEAQAPELAGEPRNGDSGVSCTRPETAEAHRTAVGRAIEAMQRRMDEELSLEDLAKVGIMSPYHFSRVFHHVTGLPPGRFLSALRLQAAKRLLVTTDANITDICFEVGYSSLGTFSRRFSEVVGVSPRGFRSLERRGAKAAVNFLKNEAKFPADGAGVGIKGTIDAPEGFSGPIFIGLFPSHVPEGRPVACTIVNGPGRFCLGPAADGQYSLFATGIGWSLETREYLLYDRALRAGFERPVVVENGEVVGRVELALGRPSHLDPPILMAIPLLLNERFREAPARQAAVVAERRAG